MKLKLPIYCKDVNKKILECIPEMIKRLNDPTLAPYVILTEGSRYSGKSQGWGRITAGLINKGALMSVLLGAPTESGMMSGFAGLIKDLTNGDYKIGDAKSLSQITDTPAKIEMIGFHASRGDAAKDLNTPHDLVIMDEMGGWGEKEGLDAMKTLFRDRNARIIIIIGNKLPQWLVEWGETLGENSNHFRIDYWENKALPSYLYDQLETERKMHPAMWKAKTLFAADEIDGLPIISATALDMIFEKHTNGTIPPAQFKCISVDVGGELGDKHCIVRLWQTKEKVIFWDVAKEYNENYPILSHDVQTERVKIGASHEIWDADGVGHAALDFRCPRELRMQSNIIEFHGGGKPNSTDFFNARSEGYFKIAQMGEMNMLKYVGDEIIGRQARMELAAITIYPKEVKDNKYRVNEKERIKPALAGKSPNIADALMMGVWLCTTRQIENTVFYNQPIETKIESGFIG